MFTGPVLLALLIGAVIGFAAGVLVYRNNKKLLDAKVSELEAKAADLEAQLKAKVGK